MKNNRYSTAELEFIRQNVRNPERVLVEMFNNSFNQKINRCKLRNLKAKLGIKSGLVGGRFEKGHVSPNKGKTWDDFFSKEQQEKIKQNLFKKGHVPSSTLPVGSEVVRSDGYVIVKVANPNVWKLKHRLVFEREFGPIPAGKLVTFLDGNKSNFDVQNLKLISRKQNQFLNKRHLRFGDQTITDVGVSISAIFEKCSKLKKEEVPHEQP